MPRALWKGAISFGLVSIPVELHGAVRDTRPHFRMLHAEDRSPVKFQRVCQREGQPVSWDDLVRGYEYEKGRFVVITKEDFQAAALAKSRTIDILDFVRLGDIDDRYFETSYYLLPSAGGERAYALLREAMRAEGRVAVAKVILREDQHLAAVSVLHDALVVTMMRFVDEIVGMETYEFPAAGEVRRQELDMARMLIGNLAGDWDPTKYTDEYRSNLMRIIRARVKGTKPRLEEAAEPRQAEVIDLMERLRRSLGAAPAATRTVTAAGRGRKANASGRRTAKKTAAGKRTSAKAATGRKPKKAA
jgi:DNA end-binding protein Ku